MARYRFVLRPKWIFGHLLVLTLVVVMINLGFWQLRRLHQRKAFNNIVYNNEAKPITGIVDVLGPHATDSDVNVKQGQIVRATGHYDNAESIVITGQSINSVPGVWLVTPLVLDDGRAVLVNRGFITDNGGLSAPPAGATPPSGTVTVTGSIQPTEVPTGMQRGAPVGPNRRTDFAFIDISRLGAQTSQALLPAWLLATAEHPSYTGKVDLQPVPPPALNNGPHLSYTIQWFSFSATGILGYPILLWRKGVDEAEEDSRVGPADDDGPDPNDGPGGPGGGEGRGGPDDEAPGGGSVDGPAYDREPVVAATG